MPFVESGFVSINKNGEELCGDSVKIINQDDSSTVVLADGLGSGVKASILSTLTSEIIGTMMASGLEVKDCVETIAHTLPVCKVRQVAYSTFSIVKVSETGDALIIQYDNPSAIIIHNGKCFDYPKKEINVYGKKIYETHLKLEISDVIYLLSDGVVHAGLGLIYNLGWRRENICEYIENNYDPTLTSKGMAAQLAGACNQLYGEMPGDDTTVAVIKLRPKNLVSVMAGPPINKDDDEKVIKSFISSEGKKIICGGTTSQLVARYLGETVVPKLSYTNKSVPPTADLKGIDLVTEGVLTLNRTIEIINKYFTSDSIDSDYLEADDGATKLAKLLIEDSTSIKFFVGRALNPAHQNPDFPAELSLKTRLIDEIAETLKAAGKRVETEYH